MDFLDDNVEVSSDSEKDDEGVVVATQAKKGKKKNRKNKKKKKKISVSLLPSEPQPCLMDLSMAVDMTMEKAERMSAKIELFKKHPSSSFECAMNTVIRSSRFSAFYALLNDAVQISLGAQAELNWRWFDPNLLLVELKLHEFREVNWYNDIEPHHSNPKCNLQNIMSIYSSLDEVRKIEILKKSVIEPLDISFADDANSRAIGIESVDPVKAGEFYQRAINLDPHCLPALYNYAELLVRVGRVSDIERCLNPLLILDPQNARGWGLRAMTCEKKRDLKRAAECYEIVHRIDNTSETRLRNFAMLMVEVKNYPRAKELYEELIALDNQDGVVIGEYADLLHTMNLKNEAVVAFERALATGNVNSTVINDYAVLLRVMGQERNNPSMVKKAKALIASIPKPSLYENLNRMAI